MKKEFRSFEDARKFVRKLNLKGKDNWLEYCKSGNKPHDIPTASWTVYKNKGWKGIGDWLGGRTRNFRSFDDARKLAHSLGLKSSTEWIPFSKSKDFPKDIPSHPDRIYKNKGWIEWSDFLGTGRTRNHRSFVKAKKFVQSLNIESNQQWRKYCNSGNKPHDIPTSPEAVYKNKGWVSYGDWLGTGYVHKKKFRSFSQSKQFIQALGLKGSNEWKEYCKSGEKPNDIPVNPDQVYKNKGWKDMGNWLGTGFIANRNRRYCSFEDAKNFVKKLNIKNTSEWTVYGKSGEKPNDIPGDPSKIYKDKGWKGYGDFLGTGRTRNYRSFEDARNFVRKLNLKGTSEWREYTKSGNKPGDIPNNPDYVYKNKGWKDMGNWLGTGIIATYKRQYRSYNDAKRFIHTLGLKNSAEWIEYCKSGNKPDDIPTNPAVHYKNRKKKKSNSSN